MGPPGSIQLASNGFLGEEIAPEDFEEPCRALGTSGGFYFEANDSRRKPDSMRAIYCL